MTTDDIYVSHLPTSLVGLTDGNVRAEVARIAALYKFDDESADSAERNLMILVLKAAAFGHPHIRSLAFAVIEPHLKAV